MESKRKPSDFQRNPRAGGRSAGIRTRGLLDPNQARYQTSPHPDILLKRDRGRAAARPLALEAPPRFELGHQDFADPCLTTWLWRHTLLFYYSRPEPRTGGRKKFSVPAPPPRSPARRGEQTGQRDGKIGASDEARTRYLHLGKVALYQMSYTRVWCPGPELNQRHADFQSAALPTELPGHRMWRRGRDLNPRPPA